MVHGPDRELRSGRFEMVGGSSHFLDLRSSVLGSTNLSPCKKLCLRRILHHCWNNPHSRSELGSALRWEPSRGGDLRRASRKRFELKFTRSSNRKQLERVGARISGRGSIFRGIRNLRASNPTSCQGRRRFQRRRGVHGVGVIEKQSWPVAS